MWTPDYDSSWHLTYLHLSCDWDCYTCTSLFSFSSYSTSYSVRCVHMRLLGVTEHGPKDICQFEAWSQKTCHIILHAFIIFHLLVWFRGSQWVSKILEYGKLLGGRTFGIKCLNRNWQTLENVSAKWASIISSHWDFMVTFYRSYRILKNLPLCLLYFSHLWYLSYVFCFPHHLEWCMVKIKYVVHDLKASCDIWTLWGKFHSQY